MLQVRPAPLALRQLSLALLARREPLRQSPDRQAPVLLVLLARRALLQQWPVLRVQLVLPELEPLVLRDLLALLAMPTGDASHV